MPSNQPALEVLRRKLIEWQAVGMSKVPARDGAKGIIEELAAKGYVIVPAEPTPHMLHAVWLHPLGQRRFNGEVTPETEVVNGDTSASIYRTMIEASRETLDGQS